MTARQRNEFASLAKGFATSPDRFLLVGDLNSTPWSYALASFRSSITA